LNRHGFFNVLQAVDGFPSGGVNNFITTELDVIFDG